MTRRGPEDLGTGTVAAQYLTTGGRGPFAASDPTERPKCRQKLAGRLAVVEQHNDAVTGTGDLPHGGAQGPAKFRAAYAHHVAESVLHMDANQRRFRLREVALDEGEMHIALT